MNLDRADLTKAQRESMAARRLELLSANGTNNDDGTNNESGTNKVATRLGEASWFNDWYTKGGTP